MKHENVCERCHCGKMNGNKYGRVFDLIFTSRKAGAPDFLPRGEEDSREEWAEVRHAGFHPYRWRGVPDGDERVKAVFL